jgi:hypothetical protein
LRNRFRRTDVSMRLSRRVRSWESLVCERAFACVRFKRFISRRTAIRSAAMARESCASSFFILVLELATLITN